MALDRTRPGVTARPEVGRREVVRVRAVAAGGAGVADLPGGRVVFVHRTVPGELVRIELTRVKSRWARGRLVELIQASEARRAAPCPYYDRCGGCTLEHLDYGEQLRWKGRIVRDALRRIGGVAAEAPDVVASPSEFRYRSRVSFHLRRLSGDRVVAGFHELERPGRVVDTGGDCLLPEAPVAEAWDRLRKAWGAGARRLPPGRALRLTLRSAVGGVILLVEPAARGERSGGCHAPEHGAGALLEEVPALRAVWWRQDPGGAALLLAGDPEAEESFLGRRVRLGAGAFLQVNREAAERLHGAVLHAVGSATGRRIVDGYCGVGAYGRALAREGATVVGIELDPDAVRAARADAPRGLEVLEGTVETRLEEALPAHTVLLNPPRGGLHADVPARLVRSGVRRLVYVSCDPATLARDVERLAGAFEPAGFRAFDLFPQTAHVETIAVLERS